VKSFGAHVAKQPIKPLLAAGMSQKDPMLTVSKPGQADEGGGLQNFIQGGSILWSVDQITRYLQH
jgi:hypothetical protein